MPTTYLNDLSQNRLSTVANATGALCLYLRQFDSNIFYATNSSFQVDCAGSPSGIGIFCGVGKAHATKNPYLNAARNLSH
ncbi:MAG: hypothetical protein KME15_02770 [Drouetiella hepatica Uher 2000/2452]|uniref:Uncharacterized protein n=1 Tax=Drouetiella hepatica Uher 2000/2452 TaxID=904376 RepID=A0A951QA50_9CYAN|nr:hypothetical protein [Drouetiella hepatica Uher 2000/2452]